MIKYRKVRYLIYFVFVQGAVLYAYYGQEEDFMLLRDKNINLNGRVMLVRAGRNSFAEKVGGFSRNYSITSMFTVSPLLLFFFPFLIILKNVFFLSK